VVFRISGSKKLCRTGLEGMDCFPMQFSLPGPCNPHFQGPASQRVATGRQAPGGTVATTRDVAYHSCRQTSTAEQRERRTRK